MCLNFQILLCWAFSCMGASCWEEGASGGGVKSQSQALTGVDHIAALRRALGPLQGILNAGTKVGTPHAGGHQRAYRAYQHVCPQSP